MLGLLRKLTIYLCKPIYKLIPDIYAIFYNIASTRLFSGDNAKTIQKLSANIYILVSVVMLFSFSVTILSAIVNPDLLNDSKKGVTAAFKRAIIGLALMVIVPFAFDEIYSIQENIMSNSLIEKIIVGANFKCNQDEDGECEIGGNGGQVIAGNLIAAVLYPNEKDGETIEVAENISTAYSDMITTKIDDNIDEIAKNINIIKTSASEKYFGDPDYAFKFNGLVAILAGLGMCYILLLYAIDMAVRLFKLAFLELTAPISIVAYMASGDKILKSWAQEVLKTFLDVFVRVGTIAFYLFLISNLSSILSPFEKKSWSPILKVLIMIGMLIFIKQVPDLINKIFGTDINLKGGIGGRLGEMAVVGKQAQAAWGAVKQAAKVGAGIAGLVASGPVGWGGAAIGAGLGVGANQLWKRKIKDTKVGRGLSTFGSGASAVGKTAGAYLKGKGLVSGIKDAKKAYSESDFGLEHIANKDYKKALKADEKFNEKMGNDSNGMIKDVNVAKTNFNNNSKKDLGKIRGEAVDALLDANIQKAKVEKITSDKDAIVSNLDTLRANAKTVEAQNAISDLKNNLVTGKYTANEFRNDLNKLIDRGIINGTDGGTISAKMDSIENKIASDKEISGKMIDDAGKLIFGASGLGEITRIANTKASNAKTTYDNLYKGSSEDVKQEMDKYSAQSEQIVTESVKNAQGETKISHKEDEHYKARTIDNSSSNTNVEHTTLQENIDRAANVHDAPTREEHISRQDDYNNLFNSDVGSRYLDANEREDDRIHGTSNGNGNNTTNSSAGSSNENANNAINVGGSSSSVNVEGLDDLFNNLNKTITNASDGTNKILQDQLNEQKNMSSELKNQTNSINNVGNKLNEFKSDVSNSFNDIKKKMDDSDK